MIKSASLLLPAPLKFLLSEELNKVNKFSNTLKLIIFHNKHKMIRNAQFGFRNNKNKNDDFPTYYIISILKLMVESQLLQCGFLKLLVVLITASGWCETNKLSFTLRRTSLMKFKGLINELSTHLGSIECKSSSKYLGLHFDS